MKTTSGKQKISELMNLCIQDPAWAQSEYLLERLIEASSEATSGGGAFAFASTGGVKLLLEDESFARFLSRSPFNLIVGVDAVTNVAALERLKVCTEKHRRLTVRVFLSDAQGGIFHPKLCWFRASKHTVFLVGSGNLTPGGLRGNCEGFTLTKLGHQQRRQPHEAWSSWLDVNEQRLFAPDHPGVLERACLNRGAEFPLQSRNEAIIEASTGGVLVGTPRSGDAVLIAEIPKSGNRWNQANFDLETFQNYFGATPGQTQRIILTHINNAGEAGPEEVRPSVAVSSHNFRFELEAASGLRYPQQGRPICVFVRVATRTFRYRLLMPGTAAHSSAKAYLNANCSASGRALNRFVTTVGAVQRAPFFSGLDATTASLDVAT